MAIKFQPKNREQAVAYVFMTLFFNISLLVGGTVLISLATNWYMGVGVALFALFLKGGK